MGCTLTARRGDRGSGALLRLTQMVDGLGAKDLVTIQKWLQEFDVDLEADRAPVSQ